MCSTKSQGSGMTVESIGAITFFSSDGTTASLSPASPASQSGAEIQRLEDDMCGATVVRRLHLVVHVSV